MGIYNSLIKIEKIKIEKWIMGIVGYINKEKQKRM